MSQPVYLPKLDATVDADPNTPATKQITAKRNSLGGAVFDHTLLPNNSGGTVGIGQGAGSDGVRTYSTIDAVLPNMALVYNSFGGTVTPSFNDAILSPQNQTNFIGVAKTATTVNDHNWTQLSGAAPSNSARMYHAMVYIPSAQVHLLHGGLGTNSSQIFGDTSFWNGQSWTTFFGGEPTDGRYGHAITVDTTHHSNATTQNLVLIFGGTNTTGRLSETWYYDGQGWAQLFPVSSPTARVHTAMTFHAANGLTMLFGGYTGSISAETWKLDVSDISTPVWTALSPAIVPPGRCHHCISYDPVRQRTVMFGGTDGYVSFNDTWEWDGTNWSLIPVTTSPPPRIDASMTYDPVNKVIVLFGGYLDTALNSNGLFNIYSDVWYYDGTSWTQQLFFGPSPRAGAAISFDKNQNYLFMLGGANGGPTRDLVFNNPETTTYQDTWELLTLKNQVDVQTIGDSYVYWDATNLLSIAPGGLVRGSDNTTVTVGSNLPHNFTVGDQFFINLPGDANFTASTVYTVTAILDANHFTYSNSGTATASTTAVMLSALGPGTTNISAEIPAVKRYLSAGTIPGTVAPNGLGNSNDGLSPIFGIVAEAPVTDSTGATFQTLIGEDRVGLVKMKMGAFYGFITGITPQIRYIIPTSGPTGTQVKIVGNGLNTTTQVLYSNDAYGSISGSYQVPSANQVNTTIAPGAQTYGRIGIVTSTGTIFKAFTVTPLITGITAASHAIGSSIVITGTTFAPAVGIGVSYPAAGVAPLTFTGTGGAFTTSYTVINDSTIHVTIPVGAITGPITLTTSDGYTSQNFTVLAPPTISLIAPLSGPTGQQIAVTGTGFLTSGSAGDGYGVVQFKNGGQLLPVGSATKTVYNDTTMTVTVPSMPGGQASTAFNLQLINIAGTVVSSQQFTIAATPTFLDAGTSGSASTTITGGSINSSITTITVVSAANFPSTGEFFIDSEQISYTGKTSGTFTGCTRGINGTTAASHSNGATVAVYTFRSDNNDFQGVAGTLVRIFGKYGFTGVSSVSFGAYEAASFHFVNDGYITATVPSVISSSDLTGAITIISTGGIANTSATTTYPNAFTIEQTPSITSINNPGNIVGNAQSGKTGDTVYLTGTNFLGVTDVKFAGMVTSASFSVVSATSISIVVPANDGYITLAPSFGPITIKKSTFYTVVSSQDFTYYPPPTSLAIASPAQDSGGDNFHANGGYGTNLSLSGLNLIQGGSPYVSISFGGIIATPTGSESSISVTVPNGANSGLALTTAGGNTSIGFNILKPVVISSISTDKFFSGQWYATPLYPTTIQVYGANFRDATHMTITVIDPSRGNASIKIPSFTFTNSGNVSFTAASLNSFAVGDLCSISFTTFYPGGSYSYTLNNAFVCYYPIS